MALQAVIFDTENVLYDATALWRWLAHVLRQLGQHTSYPAVFARWHEFYWRRVCAGQCCYTDAFRALLADQGLSRSQIGEVEVASRAYQHRIAASQRPFPGVAQTLSKLKGRGLHLGVLCNIDRPGTGLAAALGALGLGGMFDSIVTSRDLGACKPEAQAYEASLEELRTTPQRTVFVGNAADELQGAERLGLVTIAFNQEPGTRADFYAARFCEVVRLVAVVDQRRRDETECQLIATP